MVTLKKSKYLKFQKCTVSIKFQKCMVSIPYAQKLLRKYAIRTKVTMEAFHTHKSYYGSMPYAQKLLWKHAIRTKVTMEA